jgi:hypothetical protein
VGLVRFFKRFGRKARKLVGLQDEVRDLINLWPQVRRKISDLSDDPLIEQFVDLLDRIRDELKRIF